jgi:hypothetical protein
LKLPTGAQKQELETGLWLEPNLIMNFSLDISPFVRGRIQGSDLHKDGLQGLPLNNPLDKFTLIEA